MSQLKGQKVIVTGGAGFIGSHLVDALVREGCHVFVIDNENTGTTENLAENLGSISIVKGSVLDKDLLKKVFEGAGVIFHQAAIPAVPRSLEYPADTHLTNVVGTLNVFECVKELGIRRVVYASSSSVYGDSKVLPQHEKMQYNPLSPYALQKVTCEKYGELFFNLFGVETVGLRYFNVFGPRQNPSSPYSAVIPIFIKTMKEGRIPTIYGDGQTTRDFSYVDNAVNANLQAALAENVGGKVFNIASGNPVSLNELVEKINDVLGTHIRPQYADFRIGDIKHSFANIEQAKLHLKYEPKVSFDDGLQRVIQSIQ